jgi:predicted lipoprotein with Yx(FWY)xxD motif
MRRSATVRLLALVTTAVICLAAPALAAATTKVQLRHTSLGTILVNSRGFTLYAFTRDGRNRDRCASVRGCPSVWPLLAANGRTIAGNGVNRSLLGSIQVGHSRQVTYAGHPLYTYIADGGPGDTAYVGFKAFGGTWYGLSPAGNLVK